jgi:Ca2+-binding RTX toxin-like protein
MPATGVLLMLAAALTGPWTAAENSGGGLHTLFRAYVDSGATGADDGSSWEDAFRRLEDAIAAAQSSNADRRELWVAGGPYQVDGGYVITEEIHLYGGFAGGEIKRDDRDWLAHPTRVRPPDALDEPALTIDAAGDAPTIDGFRFMGFGIGNAADAPLVHLRKGSPVVRNSDLESHFRAAGPPSLFVPSGMQVATNATLENLRFRALSAAGASGVGGLYVTGGNVALDRVGFAQVGTNNVVVRAGTVTATNVTFTPPANAIGAGTAVLAVGGELLGTNITIAELSSGIRARDEGTVTLRNVIIWSIADQIVTEDNAAVTVSYSLIREGCPNEPGVTCNQPPLTQNPLLIPYNSAIPGPIIRRLTSNSPAIDAGTNLNCPDADAFGTERPVDGDVDQAAVCDLGAHEFVPPPPAVAFNVETSSAPEANGQPAPAIVVKLSKPFIVPVTVDFTTGGTATPGVDHTLAAAGTLTIPAYGTTAAVAVAAIGDPLDESNETAVLTLTNPVNANLGAFDTHTLTIVDDDVLGVCEGKSATIAATRGDDVINGTPGADVIAGLGGNDTINGLAGNDTICGGPGDDILAGGKDDDRLSGQGGVDRLRGGPGLDRLAGAGGDDTLLGGPQGDTAFGGPGSDRARGEGGDDVLHGNGAADRVDGGGGRDRLFGDGGDDSLAGGPGKGDRCGGGAGADAQPPGHGCEITVGVP